MEERKNELRFDIDLSDPSKSEKSRCNVDYEDNFTVTIQYTNFSKYVKHKEIECINIHIFKDGEMGVVGIVNKKKNHTLGHGHGHGSDDEKTPTPPPTYIEFPSETC